MNILGIPEIIIYWKQASKACLSQLQLNFYWALQDSKNELVACLTIALNCLFFTVDIPILSNKSSFSKNY